MSRPRVGIDLGARSIKVAVAQGSRVVKLSAFEDLSRLDTGPGENPVLLSWLALFVRENRLTGCPAVAGIPADRLVVFGARVPEGARRVDLRTSLAAMPSFGRELPFPDPVVDVIDAGPAADGLRPVLAVAASRSAVETRSEAIRRTGLVPAAVENGLAAIGRILAAPPPGGAAIIDIGMESTGLALVADRRLVHLSVVGIGTSGAVDRLAAEQGIDEDSAIAMLLEAHGSERPDPLIEEILEPIHRRLRGELQRVFGIHGARIGLPIEPKVAAIGGGARLLSVDSILAGTGLERMPLELDPSIELPATLATGERTGGELERTCLAIGYAVRRDREPCGLRFLGPDRSAAAAGRTGWPRHPLAAPGLALAALVAIHIALGSRVEGLDREKEQVRVQETARESAEQGAGLLLEKVAAAEQIVGEVEAVRAALPGAIVEIGRSAGGGVGVSRIEVAPAWAGGDPASDDAAGKPGRLRVTVVGTARGPREVREFASRLAGSRILRSVGIKGLQAVDGDRPRTEFEIEAEAGAAGQEDRP